jgi:hypothetical protein
VNVTLRLHPTLLRHLRRIAKDEDRSLNAQIVRMMREAVKPRPGSASGAGLVSGRLGRAARGGRA